MALQRYLIAAACLGTLVLPSMARSKSPVNIVSFQGGAKDGAGPEPALAALPQKPGSTTDDLYGVTYEGGIYQSGTIFRIDPATGHEVVLYNFAGLTNPLQPDGAGPVGGLIRVGNTLYGATATGGTFNAGTIFKFEPDFGEAVIYNFTGLSTSADGKPSNDGAEPDSLLTLIIDPEGRHAPHREYLYGTTLIGGLSHIENGGCFDSAGCGTVFRVDRFSGKEEVIYPFLGNADVGDGSAPKGGLTRVGKFIYGTTSLGGNKADAPNCHLGVGCGTIFRIELAKPAYGKHLKHPGYQTIYSFQGTASDGALPTGSLALLGNVLYGTTIQGGGSVYCLATYGCGTVFAVTPTRTLKELPAPPAIICGTYFGGADGDEPTGALTPSPDGTSLYGTTHGGGATGATGTIFQVLPGDSGAPCTRVAGSLGTAPPFGAGPGGGMIMLRNTLYGTAYGGGTYESGTLFSLSLQ